MQAEQTESWTRAADLKKQLIFIYTHTLSAPLLASLGYVANTDTYTHSHTHTQDVHKEPRGNTDHMPPPTPTPTRGSVRPPLGDLLDTKFAARQGAQEKRDTHMHTPTTPANRRAATTTLNKREAHMDGDTIGNTNKQGGRTLRVGQIVEHVSKQYRAVVLGHTM